MRASAIRLSYFPSLIFWMGISAGFNADVVLMNSWFTQAPLLRELMAKGLHVIGVVNPSQPILELTAFDYLGFTGVSRISLSSPFLGSPRPSRLFVIR